MSTNVDLSKVKIHPQKRKNGIQVYCTWCFDDGTKNFLSEALSLLEGIKDETIKKVLLAQIKAASAL